MTCFRWRIVISHRPEYLLRNSSPAWEDERREVWQSVLDELTDPALDPHRRAVCGELLRHLIQ